MNSCLQSYALPQHRSTRSRPVYKHRHQLWFCSRWDAPLHEPRRIHSRHQGTRFFKKRRLCFANMAQFRCLMQHLLPTGQFRITSQIPKVLILFLLPHFPPFSSSLIYNNREHKKFVGFKNFLTFFLFHTTTKSPILSMNSISINSSFITSIRK